MTLVLIASQPNGSLQNVRGDAQSGGANGTATFRNLDGTPPLHLDGSLVTHYADDSATGPSTAAITADTRGRLMRYIAAGHYKQIVNGESVDFHATPGSVESSVPTINVKAYGARGDGTTDDTAAINAAIVAANGLASSTKRIQVYFPDGVYSSDGVLALSNLWLNGPGATIQKRNNGSGAATNSLLRTINTLTLGSYYGTYSNIRVTGLTFDSNGKTCPAHIVSLIYVDGLELDGVTVKHSAANTTWAMMLGGRNGSVQNCKVLGGTALLQDGIHLYHGQNWRIANNYVESGDDSYPMGGEPSDTILAADPDPIRYVTLSNNIAKSAKGFALKLYVQSGATGALWEISDVEVKGLSGTSGTTRNGGVAVIDQNLGVAGTSQIKRVTIDGLSLNVGSTTHDETNPYGIWVQSASHLTLSNIDMQITEKTAAVTGMDLCIVRNSEDVEINMLRCNALQKRYGVDARDSNRVTIKRCKLRYVGGSQLPILLDDIVDLKVLDNEILDVKDGSTGINITTGTTSRGIIRGNTVKQVGGATTGQAVGVVGSAFTHLIVEGNDFSDCVNGANIATLFALGKCISQGNRGLTDFATARSFPAERYGAVVGGNITTALTAAIAAAVSAGGGTVTMDSNNNASRYFITGQIDIPDRVGLVGAGSRATVLEATTSGTYLNFEGNGPVCGNFTVNGANLTTKNIRVGAGDQRTFLPIRSEACEIALLLDQAQNMTFIGFHGLLCKRGIVFDNGAGGIVFTGHTEVSSFREWAVVFQHSGALASPFDYPVYNTFYAGMLEHVSAGAVTGVASTDVLTKTAHGFLADQQVAFRGLTGGAGLSAGTAYYVINPTTNTFQVSTTLGGSAVNFTTDLSAGTVAYAISGVVLDEAGGQGNQFVNTFLSASSACAPCNLVKSADPGGYADKRLRFTDVHFQGDLARTYTTGFELTNSTNVELGGRCTFSDLLRRFYMEDSTRARIENEPLIVNGAGAYFTNNGGSAVAGDLIRWENAADENLRGILAPTGPSWTTAASLLVAGRGYFGRFCLRRELTVALMAHVVTIFATNDDPVEVALYDSTGARIATSGSVSGKLNTATGVRTVPITAALPPGVYYAGFLCATVGGTAATILMSNLGNVLGLQAFGAVAPNVLGCQQAGLAALPTTIVPAFATASVGQLAVREA